MTCASRSKRRTASSDTPAARRRPGGPDQLDGGGPRQQAMAGAPDLTHPALAQLLLQDGSSPARGRA